MKNSYVHQDTRTKLGMEAIGIAKQNRIIAKARLEARKPKMKLSIPLQSSNIQASMNGIMSL